jgi:GNAT superfamily N-acetyltransferase
MTEHARRSRPIGPADPGSGFRSGTHALDHYFRRHALRNDESDVGRTYVLEASAHEIMAGLPTVLGYYTLSMASFASHDAASLIAKALPRYPMPVALIGRLAVDERARGRRYGEALLLDALDRTVQASRIIACLGIVVDAKDAPAEAFYAKYDFVVVDSTSWPRRMFLPMHVARAAIDDAASATVTKPAT